MNPTQALQILDIATNPANAGKLARMDYANAEQALRVLAEFISANTPKADAGAVVVGSTGIGGSHIP